MDPEAGGIDTDELDMLWSRPKSSSHSRKEEEHPVFMFVAGLGTGVLVTLLAFVVFMNRPLPSEQAALPPDNPLTSSIEQEQSAVLDGTSAPGSASSNPTGEVRSASPRLPNDSTTPAVAGRGSSSKASSAQQAPGAAAPPAAAADSQFYEVQDGDTLGSIANKFYNSLDPSYVEKLQRANGMDNPHSLKLGQKLVIPPKNY